MPNASDRRSLVAIRAAKLVVTAGFVFTALAAQAQRLPQGVSPRHYALRLTPDLVTGDLSGHETIDIDLARPTATVTLHAVGLTLEASALPDRGGGRPRVAAVLPDAEHETVALRFDPPLPAGSTRLSIDFSGKVREDLRGLYRIQSNGRWYAATQFEGTYARMMFPCFDEPEYKATFDLSVVVDAGATAISNGALLSDEPGPAADKHTITFATSPKMSTYLVALAIGDLACVAGESDGVPLRVCALPEKKELGRFALGAAEHFLHFYNGYYGIRYPFGKLDMVAFPDYEWGGMENTAAVFYKERALLVDPATASVQTRRRVASVVAHEMAHQWFGDLVTMKWWDNVWLNEGFATWMSPKPLQDWDPAWDQDLESTRDAQQVIAADSLESTRPIRQNATTAAEIKELFDGVAYGKGAAMLRMVESYVGEEVFRQGVNAYLARHANGNATAEDFWSELERVSGKPVAKVLASFIDQPGVPLIGAETRCEGGHTVVTLSQQRFFADPKRLAAGSTELWTVPICMRRGDAPKGAARCELLGERRQIFTLDGCAPWVLLNAGARGFYRSRYDSAALAGITAAAPTLAPAERVALLEDQWALVRVGRVEVADFVALASSLRGSRELPVVSLLIGRLRDLERLLDEGDVPAYRAWRVALLSPMMDELGWSPAVAPATESDDRRTLRAVVFSALGAADDARAVEVAGRLATQALADPAAVDSNLASAALPIAAAHGDAALYDQYLAAMAAAKTPEQSFRVLSALASFRDPALVRRSLDFALSPAIRAQELPGFTSQLIGEKASRAATWEFLKAHWEELQSKVTSFGGGGAVSALGSFCDPAAADDIERFFAGHRAPAAERAVQQSLESIRNCAALKERLQGPLHQWLTNGPASKSVLAAAPVSPKPPLTPQALVGTWALVSVDNVLPDGSRTQPYGAHPEGLLVFDAQGRYALQIYRADRPRFASGDKTKGTAEEYRAAVDGSNAHFGTYALAPAGDSIVFRIEHASYPNWEGTEQRRDVTLAGGELRYRVPVTTSTNGAVGEVTWRRLP